MKALKVILIVIASLVVLVVIGIAFLPSDRMVERSILVSTSADKPFKLVNDLKSWTKWSAWYLADTTSVMTYSENAEGEGAWYTWDSKDANIGKGKLTVVSSVKPDSVVVSLEFAEWEAAQSTYYFEKVGENETKVTQKMPMKANGYFGRLQILMMEGIMNQMFDQSLALIKSNAEAMPDEPVKVGRVENIEQNELPAMMYLAYTDTASIAEFGEFQKMAFGEILVQAGMQNLEKSGPSFCRVLKWAPEDGIAVVECGIPVSKEGKSAGNVVFVKTAGIKVLSADFFGPHSDSETAHIALSTYASENGLSTTEQPYEFYMNDPLTVTDPSQIHTRICYPLK